ncbi:uncharacterized protein LOC123644496 [Lemur catta]|uniref:uncharacterized protein LOC123644496 n=1 Tax=Lemur catta TaxID=9447 RepID=UPI001E26791E|nr:uncharacterized protein LOC123644496 [Lemur catta]
MKWTGDPAEGAGSGQAPQLQDPEGAAVRTARPCCGPWPPGGALTSAWAAPGVHLPQLPGRAAAHTVPTGKRLAHAPWRRPAPNAEAPIAFGPKAPGQGRRDLGRGEDMAGSSPSPCSSQPRTSRGVTGRKKKRTPGTMEGLLPGPVHGKAYLCSTKRWIEAAVRMCLSGLHLQGVCWASAQRAITPSHRLLPENDGAPWDTEAGLHPGGVGLL